MYPKKIICIADNEERKAFFNRFKCQESIPTVIISKNEKQKYINFKLISYLFVKLIRLSRQLDDLHAIRNTFEYRKNKRIKAILNYYLGSFLAVQQELNCATLVCIWNGAHAFSKGFEKHFKNDSNVEFRYLELGNIPSKLFVDPVGVNAASSIYVQNKPIRRGVLTKKNVEAWLLEYIKYEGTTNSPKQVRSPNLALNKIPHSSLEEVTSEPFIFVPLQVSSDTQLLLNADIDNLGLIRAVLSDPNLSKFKVVVKFHPGDTPLSIFKVYSKVKRNRRILFSNDSVISLILASSGVITINSTVGLQSLLLSKPTTFLGRTIFSKFSSEDAQHYVHFHLCEIDYFSQEPLTTGELNEIILRK